MSLEARPTFNLEDTSVLDEDSNATPPEDACLSTNRKSTNLRGIRSFVSSQADLLCSTAAENVCLYCWPIKSNDKYMLQEQVAQYLGVNAFKRKYPQLCRRNVSFDERIYLINTCMVTELVADLGLTALLASEVLGVMANEYPTHYQQLQLALANRTKEDVVEKQKQMDMICGDTKKMEEVRRKCLKSAVQFNRDFNMDRNDKSAFLDAQTMIIQRPHVLHKARSPQKSVAHPYPVSVIKGQFGNFYKRYTTNEKRALPLNTVVNSEVYFPRKRRPSPPNITVTESEIDAMHKAQAKIVKKEMKKMNASLNSTMPNNLKAEVTVDPLKGEESGHSCAFCQVALFSKDDYMRCGGCGGCTHPSCAQLSRDTYVVAKEYEWMCMECKSCSVCSRLDDEDKMMFCDRCDRGYHTFCVGFDSVPEGKWICSQFCSQYKDTELEGEGKCSEERGSACNVCHQPITKDNKVHHRSKYRDRGLCADCIPKKR